MLEERRIPLEPITIRREKRKVGMVDDGREVSGARVIAILGLPNMSSTSVRSGDV